MSGGIDFEHSWDVFAGMLTKEGMSLSEARDRVILAWLKDGNTDPYCYWVGCGHTPAHSVAVLIARMMQKAKAPEAEELSDLPCGLVIDGDERTLPNKEADARKFLAARLSMILIEKGKRAGKTSITDRSDAEAAKLATSVPLAKKITISPETVRQTRMELQRAIKKGVRPEIVNSLMCLK